MKIALIFDTNSPAFLRHASEMWRFLQDSQIENATFTFWLFYHQNKPSELPLLGLSPSEIIGFSVPEPIQVEACLSRLEAAYAEYQPDAILCSSGQWGNELAARLGMRLHGSAIASARSVLLSSSSCTAYKAVYEQHLLAQFSLPIPPYCISVAQSGGGTIDVASAARVTQIDILEPAPQCEWLLSAEVERNENIFPLNEARSVLAVGYGVGSGAGFQKMQDIAQQLGAKLGASRPVVMNAWSDMSSLVGISGAIVAPDICIAAGVSGAAAFSAGICHSQFIVAINNDPQAAIFAHADVAIVDDMYPVLEALVVCVQQNT
ncbi:electron transfer flavoprotein subunit alpha/FixB family protein [Hafnia alvei]|uniref:Electron transfer flavoprotein, alpha subunit n=1 Tax=Hafnia alvei TaxID=569 RepID=A0A1C6Z324_HAFAL|nr:electron transfer flavoprotein subunit alpha/FixB family protein [Hafnia alvei]NLS52587.1 electron transfer flavoprotein [Hafnia alvei]SCM53389.1 Electron transfer flavoprotein, alpha subunit [Hafnia alvei]